MTKRVRFWDLEGNSSPPKPKLPQSQYDVAELVWKDGQLFMKGHGLPRGVNRPTAPVTWDNAGGGMVAGDIALPPYLTAATPTASLENSFFGDQDDSIDLTKSREAWEITTGDEERRRNLGIGNSAPTERNRAAAFDNQSKHGKSGRDYMYYISERQERISRNFRYQSIYYW